MNKEDVNTPKTLDHIKLTGLLFLAQLVLAGLIPMIGGVVAIFGLSSYSMHGIGITKLKRFY